MIRGNHLQRLLVVAIAGTLVAVTAELVLGRLDVISSLDSSQTGASEQWCSGQAANTTVTWTENWTVSCRYQCPSSTLSGNCTPANQTAIVTATGQCTGGSPQQTCQPIFDDPVEDLIGNSPDQQNRWYVAYTNMKAVNDSGSWSCASNGFGSVSRTFDAIDDDFCATGNCEEEWEGQIDQCEAQESQWWDWENCECVTSPIIIDVDGDGLFLTPPSAGARFDLNADGVDEMVSWTSSGHRDGFLVLDRNGNGQIDDGRELFGSATEQPPTSGGSRNGFLALREFDSPAKGGNGDRKITSADTVFGALRVWFDLDHDGISQGAELFPLASIGIIELDLDYKEKKKRDAVGNLHRYIAPVAVLQHPTDPFKGMKRYAIDVYLRPAK